MALDWAKGQALLKLYYEAKAWMKNTLEPGPNGPKPDTLSSELCLPHHDKLHIHYILCDK